MQIILAMIFSFIMHIPQFFNRQDWTCDVYGCSVTNSTTDNGKYRKLFCWYLDYFIMFGIKIFNQDIDCILFHPWERHKIKLPERLPLCNAYTISYNVIMKVILWISIYNHIQKWIILMKKKLYCNFMKIHVIGIIADFTDCTDCRGYC